MKKTIFALAIGLSSTVGCAGNLMDSRWSEQYCKDHQDDYHHASRICKTDGKVTDCYYAEHWLDACREIRNSL